MENLLWPLINSSRRHFPSAIRRGKNDKPDRRLWRAARLVDPSAGRKNYIPLVPAPVVLVDAGFVESVIGAGAEVAGVLVSIAGALVAGALVSAMAGAGVLVSGAAELVMVLSVLLLQPARANGRLRVTSARREQVWRERFMVSLC
jgi:hypothetical protein